MSVADPGFPVVGRPPVEEGHQPLMCTLFGEKVCKNERNGSCWGGRAPAAPPWIRQCMYFDEIRHR